MQETDYSLSPIGFLHSPLKELGEAPNQGREGAPNAWLEVKASVAAGLEGIAVGDELIVITWLHKAQRDTLKTHPRNDETAPLAGVFATRSPDRPNPLGLHRVTVLSIDGRRLHVGPIEAIDGSRSSISSQCFSNRQKHNGNPRIPQSAKNATVLPHLLAHLPNILTKEKER